MIRPLSLVLLPCLALGLAAQTKPAPAKKGAKPAPKAAAKAAETTKSEGLVVGDAAPALKVGRWVKGTPVTELPKGKVAVVEFWATWCGPCKQTIPHLTELSKKFGDKAVFIGVDVWERGADQAAIDKKVDEFVKDMGDKMGYNVCRDSADTHMTKAWMVAANQKGIPAAFIVDGQGRIAYIGNPHPSSPDFEQALEKIIAGTWDLKAAKAKAEQDAAEEKAAEAKEAAVEAAWKEVGPAIESALEAKAHAKVLSLADAAQAKFPVLKDQLVRPRFLALAATDAAKAQALVDAETAKPSLEAYMGTASLLQEKGLDKRWAEQSVTLIDKAVALEPRIASRVAGQRFRGLLQADPAKAKAHFEAEKAKGAATAGLATVILEEEGLDKGWNELAVATLEEAAKAPNASGLIKQSLAEGYHRLGRKEEAVKTLEAFLAWAKGAGAPPAYLKNVEAKIKTYQGTAQ